MLNKTEINKLTKMLHKQINSLNSATGVISGGLQSSQGICEDLDAVYFYIKNKGKSYDKDDPKAYKECFANKKKDLKENLLNAQKSIDEINKVLKLINKIKLA
jgi:hypothetical protein